MCGTGENMKDLDRLRILLPHWIEHNSGHGGEFGRWARLLLDAGEQEIADLLMKAEAALAEADAFLHEALEKSGGPLSGHEHDHHHHNFPE